MTAIDGLGEGLFLQPDPAGDIVRPLPQVGIVALVLPDDRLHQAIEERVIHAQQLTVAGSPAQQAAQNIAAALVRRRHTVGDHKDRGADMVGNDTEGGHPSYG